jgi:hypothetical protein
MVFLIRANKYFVYIISEKNKEYKAETDDEYREEKYDFEQGLQDLDEHDHIDSKQIKPNLVRIQIKYLL